MKILKMEDMYRIIERNFHSHREVRIERSRHGFVVPLIEANYKTSSIQELKSIISNRLVHLTVRFETFEASSKSSGTSKFLFHLSLQCQRPKCSKLIE